MRTRADDVSIHAVSPLSIFGAGGVPGAGGAGAAGTTVAGAEMAGGDCASTGAAAAPRTSSIARTNGIRFTRISFGASQRGLVAFARPDAHRRLHGMNEDLAIADVPRLGRRGNDLGDLVGEMIRRHDLDLDLGEEIHGVLAAPVELGVAFLTAK